MREDNTKASKAAAAATRGRSETPSRKQRLKTSIRPSASRFASPPKMRERFDTALSRKKKRASLSPIKSRQQPETTSTMSPNNSNRLPSDQPEVSSKLKRIQQEAKELGDIVQQLSQELSKSMSGEGHLVSSKQHQETELRQDDDGDDEEEEQKTEHRSNLSVYHQVTREEGEDDSESRVAISSVEDESTDVGVEVSIMEPSFDADNEQSDDSSCDDNDDDVGDDVGTVEDIDDGGGDAKAEKETDQRNEHQEGELDDGEGDDDDKAAQSGHSSIVFNFSGISQTRSTELTVGRSVEVAEPITAGSAKNSEEEFELLFAQIRKIVNRMSESSLTPKHANHGHGSSDAESAFHQYYFSAKTLTSVFNTGDELSFSMHAQIMKHISTLDVDSTLEQKRGVVKDLFHMGIRVATEIPKEVLPADAHDAFLGEAPVADRKDASINDSTNDGAHSNMETESISKESVSLEESDSSDSDSSDDIDKRWEEYRAKYMARRTPTSSDEVDDRWDKFRERALAADVAKCDSGALSSGSDFESDLIQDCVETGMPSPRQTKSWGGVEAPATPTLEKCATEHKKPLDPIVTDKHSLDNQEPESLSSPSDECSTEMPPVPLLRRHGQPDDEGGEQPFVARRVATPDNSYEDTSTESNKFRILQDTPHPQENEAKDGEGTKTKPGQSPEPEPQSIEKSDSDTVSSELSAVNHFKNLSTSGRKDPNSLHELDASDRPIEVQSSIADNSRDASRSGSEREKLLGPFGPIELLREAVGSCS
ncbi:MAG: hypothetical protein SGILL_003364, partial [Bacillariaceae sp.]